MARTKDPALARQRRAQVLDATLDLLARGSWHGTTLAAVAAEAGVSKGVVTYWFADKDALLLAAIERYHQHLRDAARAAVQEASSLPERLARLLDLTLPDAEHVRRDVSIRMEFLSFQKHCPEAATSLETRQQYLHTTALALVELGLAEGRISAALPGLPTMLLALIDGITLRIATDPTADVEELRTQLLDHLERWFRAPA